MREWRFAAIDCSTSESERHYVRHIPLEASSLTFHSLANLMAQLLDMNGYEWISQLPPNTAAAATTTTASANLGARDPVELKSNDRYI